MQPSPAPTETTTPPDAPLRFTFTDTQLHILPTGVETYNAYRVTLLKPEALQLGALAVTWNPAAGSAMVHHVRIHRAGQVIDVLKAAQFQVIQREGALEQSMLTGNLTAMLQVPGLQLGDELDVAMTLRSRDPTLGDHAFGMLRFPSQELPGAFRYRLSWPQSLPLAFRSSRDLAVAIPAKQGDEQILTYELRDPGGVVLNDGAPGRFNIRRLIEYSDFKGWADVSHRFWPLFEDSAKLATNSPLRAQIAKIMAASADPGERAMAALRLVQDNVRYVFVGLDGGGYRPASVDDTWSRRFGDCKAKTALLLALLRAMGIEAEAVLVQSRDDDGLDARLPSASVFDHVIVRATIGGKRYWLDGTRAGDLHLDTLPQPTFRWALPVHESDAVLEPVPAVPYARPQWIGVLDMDASAGFDKPARIALRHILRGDEATAIRSALGALSAQDTDRALRSYWRREEGWVEADSVDWRFNEALRSVTLILSGTAKLEWEGNGTSGHDLTVWHGGFPPPDTLRRPRDQDSNLPWLTDFPSFKCSVVSLHLPPAGKGLHWAYDAEAMNRTIGAATYWRQSGLRDDVMTLVKSRSVGLREISSLQAREQVDAIPGFNNRMSRVFEQSGKEAANAKSKNTRAFAPDIDWTVDDQGCLASDQTTMAPAPVEAPP